MLTKLNPDHNLAKLLSETPSPVLFVLIDLEIFESVHQELVL